MYKRTLLAILLAVMACFVFACGKDKPISLKLEHYRGDWKEYDRFPIMKGKLSSEQMEKLGLKEERTKIPWLASVYKGVDGKGEPVWKDEILPPGTRVLVDKKTGLIKYVAKYGNKAFIPVQIPECPPAGPGWKLPWSWNFPWWFPLLLLIPLLAWLPVLIGRALRGDRGGSKPRERKHEPDLHNGRGEHIPGPKSAEFQPPRRPNGKI